jgi:hypothetical protein
MPLTPRQLYRVLMIGELHGQITQTAFHFRGADSSPASTVTAEISNLFNSFNTNIVPAFKLCCSQEWQCHSLKVVQLTANPGAMIDSVLVGNGAQDGFALPSFVGGVLSLRTGLTGRSRIGRIYIPGVDRDQCSLSRIEGGYLGQFQALGTLLTNLYGASGSSTSGRYGVFSRKLGVVRNAGPPPSLTYNLNGWTQITQCIAQNEVGTMRKRKLHRGE